MAVWARTEGLGRLSAMVRGCPEDELDSTRKRGGLSLDRNYPRAREAGGYGPVGEFFWAQPPAIHTRGYFFARPTKGRCWSSWLLCS
jgi:hypothetical protein